MDNPTGDNKDSQPENVADRHLGVGLRPSRMSQNNPGHMWLYWTNVENPHPPYRGFYPNINDIPEEFQDLSRWKDYFLEHSVPGILRVDYRAMQWAERNSNQCLDKHWSIEEEQQSRLNIHCEIPPGQDSITKGRYSWNEERNDWDNCSSWAIKAVNYIMDEPNFLTCQRPKRLSHVIRAIWDNQRGSATVENN
jgi:hypothetical protein